MRCIKGLRSDTFRRPRVPQHHRCHPSRRVIWRWRNQLMNQLPQNILDEIGRMENQSFFPILPDFWFGQSVGNGQEWCNLSTSPWIQRWHETPVSLEEARQIMELGKVTERYSVTDGLYFEHHVLVYVLAGK